MDTILKKTSLSRVPLKTKKAEYVIWIFVFFLVMFFVFVLRFPYDSTASLKYKYVFLLFFYLVYCGMFLFFNIKHRDLFSPLLFAYILFYFVFVFRPLLDISNGGIFSSSGKDVSAGCEKATIIFGIGMFALSIGFRCSKKTGYLSNFFSSRPINKNSHFLTVAVLIWGVSFVSSIVYFIFCGYSLSYIFSFGLYGTVNIQNEGSLLFLSTLKSCLIASFIYICIYSKNNLAKIAFFVLGLIPFILMGRRSAALIYILAPIIYYVLSKNKKISFISILIGAVLFLLFVTIIGNTRSSLAKGTGFVFSIDNLLSPFDYELTTYRCFYALVEAVPSNHNYTYGFNMFAYTVIMLIPRVIWPGKPDSPIKEIMLISVDQTAVDGGAVFPCVGEFYFEFGGLGVVIFMLLLGIIIRKLYFLRESYSGNNSHGLVFFSVEFMVLLQIFSRGNTPSNFYYALFTALPVIIMSLLDKNKSAIT